jgi:hypothetical protein
MGPSRTWRRLPGASVGRLDDGPALSNERNVTGYLELLAGREDERKG